MTDYTKKDRTQFVRVAYLLMAISLALGVSCATMSEKRYVENNTFISTYPKMAVKVSPEFEYLGEYHGNIFKDAQFGMRTANIEQAFHIFLEKGDEGHINKGLVIATFKLSTGFHWLSDFVKKPGSTLDSGEIKISGKVWPYAIWSTDNFFGPAKDFVQDKGFPTNQPFLVGTISKVIDHTLGEALGGTKLAIYYIEDRRISGLIRSSSDSAQFMDRCLKAVQFLKDERTPEKVILEPSIPFEEQLLAQGYKQLNATEIKATLSGNTAHGRFEGNTFTVYLGADGQMRGVSTSSPGKVDRDRGRWEASPDDMFCDKWDKWRSASDCDRVYLHGSKLILVNPDGTKSSELVLEQGNSRGL